MTDLPVPLLSQACRIFLGLSYPGGTDAIPSTKRPYLDIAPDQALAPLLAPPVCQALPASAAPVPGQYPVPPRSRRSPRSSPTRTEIEGDVSRLLSLWKRRSDNASRR